MASSAVVGLLRVLLTANTAEFSSAMKSVSSQAAIASKDLKTFGRQAESLGGALTKTLTLPLIAIGAGLAKIGNDFDQASDSIRSSTGATGKDLEALNASFTNVLKNVPASMQDTATAIGDLSARTGATGERLEGLATQVLNLSRVGKAELQPLIAATTRAFGDWSISTDKQAGALDFLYKTSQHTGIGVTHLTELVVQFGAPLRALGFSFEQAAALMGKWEKEGVNLETVLSGMRFALGQFAKAGKEPAAALKEVQAAILGAKTESEATAIAFQTFGKRAAVDMSRAIIEGRFNIDDLVKSLKASKETINGAAADTLSFGEKLKLLGNNAAVALKPLADIMIHVMERAIDVLTPVVSMIGRLGAAFEHLPGPVQTAAVGLGLVLASVGPLVYLFGKLSSASGTVIAAFAEKGIASRALAGSIGPLRSLFAVLTTEINATSIATAAASIKAGIMSAATTTWTIATDALTVSVRALNAAILASPFTAIIAAAGLTALAIIKIREQYQQLGDDAAAALRKITGANLQAGQAATTAKLIQLEHDYADAVRDGDKAAAGRLQAQIDAIKNDQTRLAIQDTITLAIHRGAAATVSYTEAVKFNSEWLAKQTTAHQTATTSTKAHAEAMSHLAELNAKYAEDLKKIGTSGFKEIQQAHEKYGEGIKELSERYHVAESSIDRFLNAQKGATKELKEAEKEAKKLADAEIELASSGESWRGTLDGIDAALATTVKGYLAAGVSQDALKVKYGLTDTQLHALAKSLAEETQAHEQAEVAEKKHAAAMEELASVGEGWRDTVAQLDQGMVHAIQGYLDAGVSQAALAEAYGLTDAQLKAITKDLGEQKRALDLTDKSVKETADLWEEYAAIQVGLSGSTADEQIANIHRWAEKEIGQLVDSDKNWQKHYDAIQAVATAKIDGITNHTRNELSRQARDAEQHYREMAEIFGQYADVTIDAHHKMVAAQLAEAGKVPTFWITQIAPAITGAIRSTESAVGAAFAGMLTRAQSFGEGMKAVWVGIKNSVTQILADIFDQFVHSFLRGLLGAMAGQKGAFGAAFSGIFSAATGKGVTAALGSVGTSAAVGTATASALPGTTAGGVLAGGGAGVAGGAGATAGTGAGVAATAAGIGAVAGGGIAFGLLGQKLAGGPGAKAATIGAVGGAGTGALIGTFVFPGIGTAVGAGIGALAGAITGLIGDRAGRAIKSDLAAQGIALSDKLTKQIKETAKTLEGGTKTQRRQLAELVTLPDIIEEQGGLNASNRGGFEKQAAGLFAAIQRGGANAKPAIETLNKLVTAFAASAETTGGLWDRTFQDLIAKSKELGVNLEGVTAAVQGQAKRLGSGLAAAVSGVTGPILKAFEEVDSFGDKVEALGAKRAKLLAQTDDLMAKGGPKTETQTHNLSVWKNEIAEITYQIDQLQAKQSEAGKTLDAFTANGQQGFDRLSRIALASFNAIVASGGTTITAMEQIGGAIDQLIALHDKLGLTGGAAFDQLARFRTLTRDNAELIASVGGLNDVMTALSNLGGLTADTFTDLQAQGVAAFQQLTAAGFTQQEAEQQLIPFLQNIIDLHDQTGMAIDAETQKLIDQARADGVLKAKQISTNDILLQGLGAIIKAVGGELPEAFKKFGKAGVDAAHDVTDALNDIPTDINSTITVHTGELPDLTNLDGGRTVDVSTGGLVMPGKILQFMRGGAVPEVPIYRALGSRVIDFTPKGTDTVAAMLTPGEIVLNAAQQKHVAQTIVGNSVGDLARFEPKATASDLASLPQSADAAHAGAMQMLGRLGVPQLNEGMISDRLIGESRGLALPPSASPSPIKAVTILEVDKRELGRAVADVLPGELRRLGVRVLAS